MTYLKPGALITLKPGHPIITSRSCVGIVNTNTKCIGIVVINNRPYLGKDSYCFIYFPATKEMNNTAVSPVGWYPRDALEIFLEQ